MDKSRYRMREASKDDIPGMVDVFFHSFNAPFWQYMFPNNEYMRKWFADSFQISLDNPTDRGFVIEDTQKSNRIVAFSRWMVPQSDGNLERKWPDMAEQQFDMDACGAFFGGMEENREHIMGSRPHWLLELFATHEDYQREGLGGELMRWGLEQADAEGLETYLDASEKAQPYYQNHFGFEAKQDVIVPDRPAYGHYSYVSLLRRAQTKA